MDTLFKNRYRIASSRAEWCEYNCGIYFITICTKNRKHYFGNITNDTMHLSHTGIFLDECIHKIKEHNPFCEVLNYTIMPNHLHLLISITEDECPAGNLPVARVIRGLKATVKRFANDRNIEFAWQDRFYDHIVRNTGELNRISDYISNNVIRWAMDREYSG